MLKSKAPSRLATFRLRNTPSCVHMPAAAVATGLNGEDDEVSGGNGHPKQRSQRHKVARSAHVPHHPANILVSNSPSPKKPLQILKPLLKSPDTRGFAALQSPLDRNQILHPHLATGSACNRPAPFKDNGTNCCTFARVTNGFEHEEENRAKENEAAEEITRPHTVPSEAGPSMSKAPTSEHSTGSIDASLAPGGSKQRTTTPPPPLPGDPAQWFCPCCRCVHGSDQPKNALAPFRKRCGWYTNAVAKDGDCFYTAVCQAVRMRRRSSPQSFSVLPSEERKGSSGGESSSAAIVNSEEEACKGDRAGEDNVLVMVKALRCAVAARTGMDQLCFYQILAEANPEAEWLDFVRGATSESSDVDIVATKSQDVLTGGGDLDESDGGRGGGSDPGCGSNESIAIAASMPGGVKTCGGGDGGGSESLPNVSCSEKSGEGGGGPALRECVGSERGARRKRQRGATAPSSYADVQHSDDDDNDNNEENQQYRSVVAESTLDTGRDATSEGQSCTCPSSEKMAQGLASSSERRTGFASCRLQRRSFVNGTRAEESGEATIMGATAVGEEKELQLGTGDELLSGLEEGGGISTTTTTTTTSDNKHGSSKNSTVKISSSSTRDDAPAAVAAAVTTVEALRAYIQCEGSVVGESHCLWADDFAHSVVAQHLNLLILFIDMERSPGTTPYRVLACADRPQRAIILKRQGPVGHFVFLSCNQVAAGSPTATLGNAVGDTAPLLASGSSGGGGGGGECGGGTVACFGAGDLPQVVQALWSCPEVSMLAAAAPVL